MIKQLKTIAKKLRATLKLAPANFVLRRLRQRGFDPTAWSALETFGSTGSQHTPIFAAAVRHIDIWEIKPEAERPLRQRFPGAGIKIIDSYAEIARTPEKYDLVIVDNVPGMCLGHCEHMDMFPAIFRVLKDPGVLALYVTPNVHREKEHPWAQERAIKRKAFYQAQDPDHLTMAEMERAYVRIAAENGKQVTDCFFTRRWTFPSDQDPCYYCTLVLRDARRTADVPKNAQLQTAHRSAGGEVDFKS